MKFGLTKEEYDFIRTHVVEPLQKQNMTVWCFGSRARGDHNKFSDLDLMLETIDNRKGNTFDQDLGRIREFLTQSNFPYKVDIVMLSDFSDSYRSGYERDKKKFT